MYWDCNSAHGFAMERTFIGEAKSKENIFLIPLIALFGIKTV